MPSLRFVRPSARAPLALALIAAVASTLVARASVVRDVPLEEMVRGSEVIVLADVEATGSRLELNQGRLVPVTRTHVRVLRWLKGRGSRRLVVRTPGGAHPGGERRVVGAPRFRPGEQVLLFLRRDSGDLVPFGLSLGVYRVDRGRGPIAARVARRPAGVAIAERRGGQVVVHPDRAAPAPLAAFMDRVAALVSAEAEGSP